MPRRTRTVVIAAVVLAVLAAVAVVLLRQAMIGGPLREAAEQKLSNALGQPVAIGGLGAVLFPRPAVLGAQVRVGSSTVEAPALRIERIRIVPRLRSLFGGDLEIDAISLDGFTVSVLRDENGQWQVPALVPAPTTGGNSPVSIARVGIVNGRLRVFERLGDGSLREAAEIDGIAATVIADDRGLRLPGIRGRIGTAEVSGEASVTADAVHLSFSAPAVGHDDLPALLGLLGSARPESLRLDQPASVSADVRVERANSRLAGHGTLKAPSVALDALALRDVEAPFSIDGARVTFEPATFAFYGGLHRGTVSLQLAAHPPQWSADSHLDGMDLGAFLDALAGGDARLDGTATADASVSGSLGGAAATLRGRAHLTVADGVVQDFPLLAAINRTLGLAEGSDRDTRFERLSATFALGNGGATTDDLLLEAAEVRLAAAGRIGFDRTLNLHGVATLSAGRTAAAVTSIHELSRLRKGGRLELPLMVSGSLDDPAFGIDLKAAIGGGIRDELLRRLRGIIRR